MKKNRFGNTLSLIGHIGILSLLYRWWSKESDFNYEAAIGIVSYLLVLGNWIRSQIIDFPYLKYYSETHENIEGEKGFYTMVVIWSLSTKRITNDFLGVHFF